MISEAIPIDEKNNPNLTFNDIYTRQPSKASTTARTSITSRTTKSVSLKTAKFRRTLPNNSYALSRFFLHDLRRCFEDADTQEKGYLTLDQWLNSSLRNFIQDGKITDEDYQKYFMRIDADNDGIIDWNEIVLYLSKEIEIRELHIDNETMRFIHKPKLPIPSRSQMHREMIQQISMCYFTGEYVTMSPDSIRFWNPTNLAFKRSINEPGFFSNFCIFDSLRLIAVATTKRQLLFYELDSLTKLPVEVSASPTSRDIRRMDIPEAKEALQFLNCPQMPLGNVPQTICSADDLSKPNDYTKIFFVGDDSGLIEVFKIKIPMRRRGTDYLIVRIARTTMHKGGINQISPIDTLKCYASCSMDHTVKFWNFLDSSTGNGGTFTVLRTFTDKVDSILGFNFSPTQKIIVTYGVSRDAYVWAISPPRKLFKLGGHYNAIQCITDFITSNDEKYVLTITNRKEFRLWDSVNFRMVYEWNDNDLQRPENHYSASFFDLSRHSLITCSSYPSKWTEDVSAQADIYETLTHGYPIVGTFYTTTFEEIVTVDCISTIKIWNYHDGSLRCAHKNCIDKSSLNNKSNSDTLSAACIDSTGRRLITSSFSKKTLLWNFNSGTEIPISNLTEPSNFITIMKCATISCRDYYARASWDKNVMLFMETEKGHFDPYRMFSGHKSDISAMTEFNDGIVTGDVDGELFEWILETNTPKEKVKLNSSIESLKAYGHFLFVGDGSGNLHIYSLPKLIHIRTIGNAHDIKKPYILSAIEIDHENGFLYTGDTFGYVKKWKLLFEPVFKIEPYLPGLLSLKRCSQEEINTILVVNHGNFIVTSSNDRIVRFWVTSPKQESEGDVTLFYLGFFNDTNNNSNSKKSGWDIFDIQSSIKKNPFEIDRKHFESDEIPTERLSGYIKSKERSIAMKPSIKLNEPINDIGQQLPTIPIDFNEEENEQSSLEVDNDENTNSKKSVTSFLANNDFTQNEENIEVIEEEQEPVEEAFSFTNAGKMIYDFMQDEEYKKNRPVLPPEMDELLGNNNDTIPSARTIFNITQPTKKFKPLHLQPTARPMDIINGYQSLRKRPVPTVSDYFNNNNSKNLRRLSTGSLNTAREISHISALTKPIYKPRTSKGTRSSASAKNKIPLTASMV